MTEELTVATADNRTLQVLLSGPENGPIVVFHHGTPASPVRISPLIAIAMAAGVRLVQYARPGYAGSTTKLGRTIADAAADTNAIVTAIGGREFVSLGQSGGGAHALACAALAPDCLAVATVAGVAPFRAEGLDWLAGMGPENIDEFDAAAKGLAPLEKFLADGAPGLATATSAQLIDVLGGLLPRVDKEVLTGAVAEWLVASSHHALSAGTDGWRDDDIAMINPWGFDVHDIAKPVAVWQGGADLMVPYAHGAWLAANLPTAQPHLFADHGHLSLVLAHMPEILADLLKIAGLR